ncbi:hypothetical protein M404DRAFT_541764 [Pisolithus tinctorius Marx 270]|uniref:Uncharacterized protein n=1 Tax=Pisolithus tinctorius Marx 270 TaxID=870435 RepID=A0A0C3PAH1_PISTI|nr:hypothetical protein M404DRAFT_541764 [Pisolithus tinctorius Marx 270]
MTLLCGCDNTIESQVSCSRVVSLTSDFTMSLRVAPCTLEPRAVSTCQVQHFSGRVINHTFHWHILA